MVDEREDDEDDPAAGGGGGLSAIADSSIATTGCK